MRNDGFDRLNRVSGLPDPLIGEDLLEAALARAGALGARVGPELDDGLSPIPTKALASGVTPPRKSAYHCWSSSRGRRSGNTGRSSLTVKSRTGRFGTRSRAAFVSFHGTKNSSRS